jgi:hypothetical protein
MVILYIDDFERLNWVEKSALLTYDVHTTILNEIHSLMP